MQAAPLLPSHLPVCARQVCSEKSVSSEPCPLSLTHKTLWICELILPCQHTSCFLPPHTSLMPSTIFSFFHVFLVFISSASFLALAPYSPPSTPITSSSLLYFQIKLGCEGAGECYSGDWLFPECCLCPDVPQPCLKRSFPLPALPFILCGYCKGAKPQREMRHILLPQPGIPSLTRAGLHPTARSS